ncbi:hypothetical protein IMCC3135_10830 [Granulosicoccus antarcticus IMCC3135]|uniref:PRC-barrel domain-containing protein n=2 Tax=Granulosicoccus TaxID=437504 RepID=A0A2Z2NRA0_9GAMM|nr:hypothetical protein IMCC3135_10830 [Granulosicoccus antarcticus IMCC3135]
MLAELRDDNKKLATSLREVHDLCNEHRDITSASRIEEWIDELLPSSALVHLDSEQKQCSINLTMQQIKDSPDVDTERSVSRQMEFGIYNHYGYNPYWNSGYGCMGDIGNLGSYSYLGGMGGALPCSSGWRAEEEIIDARRDHDDVHLRSMDAITGYHIHASDGQIGHVEDFLINDTDWNIRYLVVDTNNWWPGKKVLVSPRSIENIDWSDRQVNVGVDRRKIQGNPDYDASVLIDQHFEVNFLNYYGIKLVET